MDTYFKQLDEILYHNLRPWLDENNNSDHIASLSSKLNIVTVNFVALYDFDFYRPFNAKAEFYHKSIVNAGNTICNSVLTAINEDDNELRQKYVYDEFMNDMLPKRLNDVIEVIKENHYFIEYIDPKKGNFEVNPEHKTNSYIIQFLKISLVKVYLEIQAEFGHLNREFTINERDIYDRFFNQGLPENSFLTRNENKKDEKNEKTSGSISGLKETATSRHSLTLNKDKSNTDFLSDLFSFLKENNIIAKENPLAVFKWIFSGKEVASPVIWTGSTNELYYFIYLIHDKHNLIEPIRRNYWKVVCKCFIKQNGTQFNPIDLKAGKKPQNSSEVIEKAVGLLILQG